MHCPKNMEILIALILSLFLFTVYCWQIVIKGRLVSRNATKMKAKDYQYLCYRVNQEQSNISKKDWQIICLFSQKY